jgi:hypothetical protein
MNLKMPANALPCETCQRMSYERMRCDEFTKVSKEVTVGLVNKKKG